MPSDAEVVCGFMCERPEMPTDPDPPIDGVWLNPWWMLTLTGYENGDSPIIVPRPLDLDALWEVEQKLKESGELHSSKMKDHPFMVYTCLLMNAVAIRDFEYCNKRWGYHGNPHDFFPLIHLTAAQKQTALAAVIRGIR